MTPRSRHISMFSGASMAAAGLALTIGGTIAQDVPAGVYEVQRALIVEKNDAFQLPPPPGSKEAGLRAGSFLVTPIVEAGALVDTNVSVGPGGGADTDIGLLLRPGIEIERKDDDLRFSAYARGELIAYASTRHEDVVQASAGANLVRDFGETLQLRASAEGGRFVESRSGLFAPPDVRSPVKYDRIAGRLELTWSPGRFVFVPSVGVDRVAYHDGVLRSNSLLPSVQRGRSLTRTTAGMTVGYAVSPDLLLFVGGEYNDRNYDVTAVPDRDSHGYVAFGGARVNLSPVTRLEVAAGYRRQYYDPAFVDPKGLYVRAALDWSPTRSTVVGASFRRDTSESGALAQGGVVRSKAELRLQQEVRRDLRFDGSISHQWSRVASTGENRPLTEGSATLRYYATPRLQFFTTAEAQYWRSVVTPGLRDNYHREMISGGIRWSF